MKVFCLIFSRFLTQVMSDGTDKTDEEILLILLTKDNTKNAIQIRRL